MHTEQRNALITASWELHAQIEDAYTQFAAKRGDAEWLEKQRFLLADMALHLFQTVIADGPMQTAKLQNNLYSILTICHQFFPHVNLSDSAQQLLSTE
ncbi:hypothetical protein DRW07_10745 [Alteromonas sediminis]|uniref:Uncharacterized protein n=1 Tax=Alteromonas sediminis TaxID=2259342 RepID=A0A3N5YBT5_9ALTE|nr:hypothetical protein [Alteromonas sediminis]RPJ66555.1 hypothetical protein DRW07_10745 [Alteromonas sediminis]